MNKVLQSIGGLAIGGGLIWLTDNYVSADSVLAKAGQGLMDIVLWPAMAVITALDMPLLADLALMFLYTLIVVIGGTVLLLDRLPRAIWRWLSARRAQIKGERS